jgi:hypothetical protein
MLRTSRFFFRAHTAHLAAVAAAAIALAAAPAARAQDTAAEGIFDEGLRLFDAGDYASACPKLKSAVKLSTSEPLGGKLLLAECYEKQGKWASAWALYREVVAKAAIASQPARREKAEAGQARVEPKLPRLRIQLAPAVASLPGLAIDRDGEAVPKETLDVALPVDPGAVTVTVMATGKITFKTTIQVEDAPKASSLRVEKLDDDPQAVPGAPPLQSGPPHDDPPMPPPRAETEDGGIGGLGIAGIAIGGVGLVGIGVSAIVAAGAKSSWKEAVGNEDQTGVDDARGTGDAATGVFIAGSVLTAVGITLLVVDVASSDDPQSSARIRLRTAGTGISAEGAF